MAEPQPPVQQPTNPPNKQDEEQKMREAYRDYLSRFSSPGSPGPRAPSYKRTGNIITAQTPLSTSGRRVPNLTIGKDTGKTVAQKIESLEGGKKKNDNTFELLGKTAFETPLPYDEFVKRLVSGRKGLAEARRANASSKDRRKYLKNRNSTESYNDYKKRTDALKNDKKEAAKNARSAGANDEQIREFLKARNAGEQYADFAKRRSQAAPAQQPQPVAEADQLAADAATQPESDVPIPEADADSDETDSDPGENEPAAQEAPTPAAPARPLSFEEQAQRANQMAAQRARERKGATAPAAPAPNAQASNKEAGKSPADAKQAAQNQAQNVGAPNQAPNQAKPLNLRDNAANRINRAGAPLMRVLNARPIRRIDKQIKENDKTQRTLGKEIQKPKKQLASLQNQARRVLWKIKLLKAVYAFLWLLSPILLLIGIDEISLPALQAAISSAKKVVKELAKKIRELKTQIQPTQDRITALQRERLELFRQRMQYTQVMRQRASQQNTASNEQTAASQGGSSAQPNKASQPWNAPADLNQNELSSNMSTALTQANKEEQVEQAGLPNSSGITRADQPLGATTIERADQAPRRPQYNSNKTGEDRPIGSLSDRRKKTRPAANNQSNRDSIDQADDLAA